MFFMLLTFIGNINSIEMSLIDSAIQQIKSNHNNSIPCGVTNATHHPVFQEDKRVNYLLFTRKNPQEACDLQPTVEALQKCNTFDPNLETKVLIHGWIDSLPPEDLKFVMKDRLLTDGEYNVVVHNWTWFNQNVNQSLLGYSISATTTIVMGLRMSAWIKFLQINKGAQPEKFQLIGHSLGSEVASYAGKTICRIGKITFLDPAAPLFRFLPPYLRPSYTDGIYVEAIHTNGAIIALEGSGFIKPLAYIDFYPNGGEKQPKCYCGAKFHYVTGKEGIVDSSGTEISCNHYSVYDYYLESFNTTCSFRGFICNSYEDFQSGVCQSSNPVSCKMGIYAKEIHGLPPYSKCYFQTSAHSPYCLN